MDRNREFKQLDDNLFKEVLQIFEASKDITTDSRKVKKGSIFVALKGEVFDANTFARSAVDSGAALVVIDNKDYYIDRRTLLVENTLQFLQKFANYYRRTFDIPFIAISGTNGKTTTKELMLQVLGAKYKTQATFGNLNNHIGVPLTLLSIKRDCQIAIIEMGASHRGDINELCEIAEPNIALLTNIGTAHIEGFGSFEGVVQTKTELYRYVEANKGKIFVNIDDENLKKHKPLGAITYSLSDKADIKGEIVAADSHFATLNLQAMEIKSQLVGSYNCYNILAAASVGLYFGVDMNKIKNAIEQYSPSNNRSQVKKTEKNTLILDCYNANPSSCRYALNSFNEIKAKDKRVFIGSMKELGEITEKEHKAIVEILQTMNLTQIILVGQEYKPYSDKSGCLWFATSEQARDFLQTQDINNSLILIKGSRATKMEVLADVL